MERTSFFVTSLPALFLLIFLISQVYLINYATSVVKIYPHYIICIILRTKLCGIYIFAFLFRYMNWKFPLSVGTGENVCEENGASRFEGKGIRDQGRGRGRGREVALGEWDPQTRQLLTIMLHVMRI
jgi:hypothetical protein